MMRAGPSTHSDSSANGTIGISAPQITSPSRSTGPILLLTILPLAQQNAAHSVSTKPATLMPPALPAPAPIRASPPAATAMPAMLCQRTGSPSHSAAMASVKKACDCSTSEASPAGMPTAMA
ncbi:hypothetical protein D9M72_390000 [compost metagenome]